MSSAARQLRERQPQRGVEFYGVAAVLEDPAASAKLAIAKYCSLLASYRRRAAAPDHRDVQHLPELHRAIVNLERLIVDTDLRALQLSGFSVCTS